MHNKETYGTIVGSLLIIVHIETPKVKALRANQKNAKNIRASILLKL